MAGTSTEAGLRLQNRVLSGNSILLPSKLTRSFGGASETMPNLDDSCKSTMTAKFLRATAAHLLSRLQQGSSHPPIELVYIPHKRWPLPHPRAGNPPSKRPIRISILDSSFNPPTLAHLALANSPRPNRTADDDSDYDAKLLLLSVKNADKTLKPGDATYLQRLEMMALLAKDVVTHNSSISSQAEDDKMTAEELANVAIAITDQPTFVGKSKNLLDFLMQRYPSLATSPHPDTQLTFLLGLDTLQRLFSPKYYPSEKAMIDVMNTFLSPEGDNSRVVCARRVSLQPSTPPKGGEPVAPEDALALAHDFITSEQIFVINIGNNESKYSSSAVRNSIARLGFGASGREGDVWKQYVPQGVADYITQEGLYVD